MNPFGFILVDPLGSPHLLGGNYTRNFNLFRQSRPVYFLLQHSDTIPQETKHISLLIAKMKLQDWEHDYDRSVSPYLG